MELGQRLLPHSPTATGKKSDHEDVSILKDTLSIMAWPVHRRCFIFLFVLFKYNPLRFIFYHPRSTDFEEKIEGL